MEMIKTQDLAFTYPGTEDQVNTRALRGVDVTIERGSFVVILGHNGSGKSTLAKTFNAVLLPSGGKVYVEGMDTMDESLLLEIRRRVGMVFQNPDNQIVANVVEEDVAFAPENLGVPSAGLDPQGREELLSNIREFHRARGTTVVLVSHSMEEIAKNVDRIVVLSDSHVLMSGTPREVFARGDELMTAGLDVPQVTRVAMALRDKGIAINPAVYTVDELSKELVALKRGGGKKC